MKDPCTIALELDQELMAIHEHWMNDETIEEFLNDSQMNIQCDEFAQDKYTVWYELSYLNCQRLATSSRASW